MKRFLFFALLGVTSLHAMHHPERPYENRNEVGRKASKNLPPTEHFSGSMEFRVVGTENIHGRRSYRIANVPSFLSEDTAAVGMVRALDDGRSYGRMDVHGTEDPEQRRKYLDTYFQTHGINEPVLWLFRPGLVIIGLTAILGDKRGLFNGPAPIWNSDFFLALTPFQIAAIEGDWFLMEYLVAHGADPEATTADVTQTPLQLLIDLVHWEQEQLGDENLAERLGAAEQFVHAEWARVLETPRFIPPTRFAQFRDAALREITDYPIRNALSMLMILFSIYLTMSRGSQT